MMRVAGFVATFWALITGALILAGTAHGAEVPRVTKQITQVLAEIPAEKRAQVLEQLSEDELQELARATEQLHEFIPRVSPQLQPPRHLQPIVDVIESCWERPRNVVISTPPQHGKTETCLHGLTLTLQRIPQWRNAYVTYEAGRAHKLSKQYAQPMATRAGIPWSGNAQHWRTPDNGGIFWTGVNSVFTGEPVDGLLLVDDPIKGVVEANSATYRERADEWIKAVARTRMHPSASCIVIHTRWHPDDLAGRLINRGWDHIELPAINAKGEALWPEARPLPWLEGVRKEVGEYIWASLYQCQPRARGAAVFGDSHYFDLRTINLTGCRMALGADLAYSTKKWADWSVALVLAELNGTFYVLDVQRHRVKAPQFDAIVKGLKKTHGVHKTRWYTSSTEEGLADMIAVKAVLASDHGDKFVRAQPVAAAWNAGKILVPKDAPWTEEFIRELVSFTGVDDDHDDQVDAFAAAYDALHSTATYGEGWGDHEMPKRRI